MTENMGKQIRAGRQRSSLTQEKLAEALGVTPQAVSKWERGESLPDIALLPELSAALGLTLDELFESSAETHLRRIQQRMENEPRMSLETFRQAEAQQRHERGRSVREVVQAVCRNGHRAGQRARQQLARRQQHIAHDADDPGQLSVAGAHGGILRVPVVLDKQAQQQLRQIHRSPFRPCRYLFIIRNFVEKVYLFLQEPCNSSDL